MYIIKKNQILKKEIIIQYNKFLCFAKYVESENDVIEFLKTFKDRKASFNAYAYVIGLRRENIFKTDNGEIRHEAGRPILDAIIERDLTNIIVLVIRYCNSNTILENPKSAYGTITRLTLETANMKKIAVQLKIGILLRPLYENFLRNLLQQHNINIFKRTFYRRELIITIIVENNHPIIGALDQFIIDRIIYSYKIIKT
ncbi:IMPACT family protein [Spiroplasma chrysopicola]|uniref:Impact N-terminal domain-containing protein n=1 Tax=Spiroplasma chrysopicola DF-1 TaxID=1276227 RepID=R4UH62_9MOLU|nr:YigZ family protein [Spiroplasma chrysopicola]AGM24656.1 hypothetical protein SCHRY_v1c00690 [Spiroplasma chrysopicola DF-1]